jgi:hypothetical protein
MAPGVRRYSHEEQEEERERHHSHNDVKNHLRERGDRLDVYSAEQRWADDLVSVQHSVNFTADLAIIV